MERKVLDTINGREISNIDLDNAVKSMHPQQQMRFQSEEGKKRLLEDLVNQELFYLEAKDNKVDEERKVLATINGREISNIDLDNAVKSMHPQQQMRFQSEEGKKRLLEDLVNQELFYLEAKDNKVDETEEFKALMEQVTINMLKQHALNQLFMAAMPTEEEAKAYYDEHQDEFKVEEFKALMEQVTINMLKQHALNQLFMAAMPTEEEAKAYYDEHQDEFKVDEMAKAKHILIKAELKQHALNQLFMAAMPTEEEAKAYYDEHQDEFKVDEMAKAKHILIKADDEAAFEAAEKRAKEIAEEIKAGEKTFEQAAMDYSDCPSNMQGGDLGLFGKGQMVPEFEEAVFSMNEGELSEPVKTSFG